jgi:hypothetical protein
MTRLYPGAAGLGTRKTFGLTGLEAAC